jgi:hypothetical protein
MKTPLIVLLATGLAAAAGGSAFAQDPPSSDSTRDGGPGVRAGHITSTGETVPNPGASQGAGTTPMDRGIQERDNKIDSSICKGC